MLNRREALFSMLAAMTACRSPNDGSAASLPALPDQKGDAPPKESTDDVDAMLDTLLPGALDAGVHDVLANEDFGRIAFERGFIPIEPPKFETVRDVVNADLARLAFPLARFADHPRAVREQLIEQAMIDQPIFMVMRAACFFAWLGGFTNDKGLVAIGFPPYVNLADGLAVSGYASSEYSYERAPLASIELGLDENGDLP